MGRMAELDSEIREAIESGCTYGDLWAQYERVIGADQIDVLWFEYHGNDEDEDEDDLVEEHDGQPTTYQEYQDLPWGGDDWDHGQFGSEF